MITLYAIAIDGDLLFFENKESVEKRKKTCLHYTNMHEIQTTTDSDVHKIAKHTEQNVKVYDNVLNKSEQEAIEYLTNNNLTYDIAFRDDSEYLGTKEATDYSLFIENNIVVDLI